MWRRPPEVSVFSTAFDALGAVGEAWKDWSSRREWERWQRRHLSVRVVAMFSEERRCYVPVAWYLDGRNELFVRYYALEGWDGPVLEEVP